MYDDYVNNGLIPASDEPKETEPDTEENQSIQTNESAASYDSLQTNESVVPDDSLQENVQQLHSSYQSEETSGGYTRVLHAQPRYEETGNGAEGNTAAAGRYGATYNRYDSSHIPKEPVKKEKTSFGGFVKKVFAAIFIGLVVGLFIGTGIYAVNIITDGFGKQKQESRVAEQPPAQSTVPQIASPQGNAPVPFVPELIPETGGATAIVDASAVVEKCMPSIVAITNKFTQTYQSFWGRQQIESEASGSGIIVGENETELLIVTNSHVIADAEELKVMFTDGESYDAKIKGSKSDQDLAVIAVLLSDMSQSTKDAIAIAALGDSDALRVGEPAIAIGNSLGYGQSVTSGIISAVGRDFTYENKTRQVIQTDAAINPGNSGGALLNIRGEVIGINEAKYSDTSVEGVGYAIPISTAKPIIDDLVTKTTKSKVEEENAGFLGIGGVDVTEEVAQIYGMPIGIYIAQVSEGSAAEKAGIVKGDIITEFDGESVDTMEELKKTVGYYAAGTTVEIRLQRVGQDGYEEQVLNVTLGKRPKE